MPVKAILVTMLLISPFFIQAQDGGQGLQVGLLGGVMNYQGDLKPNSFTVKNSNASIGLFLRQPLHQWFSVRAGFVTGRIEAADANNRDYLKQRNLSFASRISELSAGIELHPFSRRRISPYFTTGLAYFHFNPYTHTQSGTKVFLQPLSTEGQGLPEYASRKIYGLNQWALALGGGLRVRIAENFSLSLELNQRKTFTDYLDDVSTTYADPAVLERRKGPLAAELSYRGGELPGGAAAPHIGSVRGTPTEKDWYYFMGLGVEMNLRALGGLFSTNGWGRSRGNREQRCPTIF